MSSSARLQLSRRDLLAGVGALAGTTAVGACAPAATTPSNPPPSSGGSSLAPRHIPFPGVDPDLPGTSDGVSSGFLHYPEPAVARPGFPLPSTEPVSALLQNVPPQLPPERNPAYRRLQEQAGNRLDATIITSAQYLDKMQVTLASGNIPDFLQISPVAELPRLLSTHFTDLTDILGGDGVAAYPGLASIPTPTWQIPVVNGRLWGIAQPRPPAGLILSTRGDVLAEKGIDPSPEISDGEDFLALLAELTDRTAGRFAMGSLPTTWLLPLLLEMHEAPNEWAEVDGRFISVYESPQYKEALDSARTILAAGYLHPNSFADPAQNKPWWEAGVTALYRQAFTGWGVFARLHPDWNVGHVRLPKWQGGEPARVFASVAGYGAYVAIRKQKSQARLEELLRIADLIASPFGTQEYLDVQYGALDFTYRMQNGNPEYLPEQTGNVVTGWPYLGGQAQSILFNPGQDELTRAQHTYLTETIPTRVVDPSQGRYSETKVTKGSTWNSRLADAQRKILLSEDPVSSWDQVAAEWKSAVGDAISRELTESA